MEETIVYFASGGKHNTDTTLKLARERAIKRKIKNVVVASHSGFTAEKALKVFKDDDVKLTIVVGRRGGTPHYPPISERVVDLLEESNHNVCYAGDVKYEYPELARICYKRLCEGVQVIVNIIMAATDQGLIPVGEEVVAVAGTGSIEYEKGDGADTAVIIEAMKSSEFFKPIQMHLKEQRRKIKEIICKPR